MNSEPAETSTTPIKSLLELITKHCGKISVAKRETSELGILCTILNNRLGDLSLGPHHSNYDHLKSELVKAEEQLAGWSKYKYAKSLMKRKDIEAGVAGLAETLKTFFPAIQPTPALASNNHGLTPLDRRNVERALPREGAGDNSASVVTDGSYNNHDPPPRQTTEPETQGSHSVEATQPPSVKRLDGEVTRGEERPIAGGMYCDVWIGYWKKSSGEETGAGRVYANEADGEKTETEKVALKVLRMQKSPEKMLKKLERELPKWTELGHKNILPFYGIITDIGQRVYMVSPWRENGNLLAYVRKNHQLNKNYMLRGSAAGLSYLHSKSLVHGSVKCNNVLISPEGEPQICDFGIARIIDEATDQTTSKTVSSTAIVRYAAPELIELNGVFATTHSDTYSFAMLILECITEEVPFSNITRDAAVIHARIGKRQSPPRPEGKDEKSRVSDNLWDLMKRCWSVRPDDRPTMEHVHLFFLENPSQ